MEFFRCLFYFLDFRNPAGKHRDPFELPSYQGYKMYSDLCHTFVTK